ncbi:Serine-aspartate repeat-containing protein D precursor [Stieleria magnilauensis]|uniref:Serine-aspartate repeat-containing protein D n=2 Tax=Stieleria magnilauensis TaxID=2527963 RepID=A0ABX5XHH5_9BACT|nr:Serine-aspartate repeat-containing protein D precursor [Planctomycetes bacterium TBK1r]
MTVMHRISLCVFQFAIPDEETQMMNRSHELGDGKYRRKPVKSLRHHRRCVSRRNLLVEQLESRRLLAVDYGDAPDASDLSGAGDYATRSQSDGAAHEIVPGLFLGRWVDGDSGTAQGSGAKADDHSTVLADLTADFVAAVDPAAMTAGDSIDSDAAGGGTWQYLVSESIDPSSGSANLQRLAWDTTLNAFEDPAFDHTDGSNGDFMGFPSGDELAFHPRIAAASHRLVARWVAGSTDAGQIAIEGRVRKSDIAAGDGTRLLVYADSVLVFDDVIEGEDGRGFTFTLPEVDVAEGSIVDFVIDANSSSNSDSTRLSATITRGDDEDGVVGGNLEDFDLLPGRQPEIQVVATNLTDKPALLAGWIDFNQDGVFDDAVERAVADVPIGSDAATVTLVFPEPPENSVFTTYARLRLSSDTDFVADPHSDGLVDSGEVEDYRIGRPSRVWVGQGNNHSVFNGANWAIRDADGTVTPSSRPPRFYENVVVSEQYAGETLLIETDRSDRFRVRSMRSAADLQVQQKGLLQINQDSRIAGLTLDGVRTDFGDSLQAPSGTRLTIDGDLRWNQAQINSINLQVMGNLLIDSDREHALIRSAINVYGDASIWSGGDINASSSTIRNHGTLTTTSNADSLPPGAFNPPATIVNESGATWIHDAPPAADDEADLFGRFYNHGTLQLDSGKLAIGDCCTPLTHTGHFNLLPGTELTLRSKFTLDSKSSVRSEAGSVLVIETSNNTIRGAMDVDGTLLIEGGVDFDTAVSLANLTINGGSIVASDPVNVTEHFQFLGGTLGGGTITSEKLLTLGSLSGDDGLTIRSNLINEGRADWQGQSIHFDNGSIVNRGVFVDASGGNLITPVFKSGNVENHGRWTIDDSVGSSGVATRKADFVNHGDFMVAGQNVEFYRFDQESGTLQLANGAFGVVGGDLNLRGGQLVGDGQINGSVLQSGGTISPGMSPGILGISGDLIVTEGDYLVQIGGPATDENGDDAAGLHFDRVTVGGNSQLDRIRVELLGDYQPTLSSRYLVLQASGVSGPASDNASDVGMTIPGSDSVVELVVTTLINSPPIADAGGPYSGVEGTQFILDATNSFSAKQSSETLEYHWDLDYDGATFDPQSFGATLPVTFYDDVDPPRTIAVRVTDTDGDVDIASTTFSIANVAPDMRGAFGVPRLSIEIDDDYVATLVGQFEDPGHDTQAVLIDWGDGFPPTELALSDVERDFSANRTYPIPDSATNYLITVTVTDKDGGSDTGQIGLEVREPLSEIRGIKFDDANGNGIQDTDELGLPGWTIELFDPTAGQILQTAVTDASGAYVFEEVALGAYQLRETQQFGWHQTFPVNPLDRISTAADGTESDGQSDSPSISADGRFIAFSSLASNLVADDANRLRDIFVKDTATGAIERVSLSVNGDQPDGASYTPSISGDGNIVVYRSVAQNLVQDDRNVASDIFAYDRRTGVTRRVSANLDLDEGNEDSFAPSISGNGRFVAFESTASNLVAGDTNGVADIFVTDLHTGLTKRVSIASNGSQSNRGSFQPSLSDDGRYVVFSSGAQTLDDRDRDLNLDIYVYDRARNALTIASRGAGGQAANGDSFAPAISGDGQVVSFATTATNLLPGDTNGQIDVYVSDWTDGRLRRVTHGNGPSSGASLNADGTNVLFTSYASDLVSSDTNNGPDVFFHDRTLDVTKRVGQSLIEEADHFALHAVLSQDASVIAMASDGSNLIANDANARRDLFTQRLTGSYAVKVDSIGVIDGLDFGNQFRLASISGQKFADENGNGVRDVDAETGAFVEPGLDGWTIQAVNSRTGESFLTVTSSVDLDGNGVIDPISEQGLYEFSALPPGGYEVFERLEDGWIPSSPRLQLPVPLQFRAPISNDPPPFGPANDPRLSVPASRLLRTQRVRTPVTRIPAVAEGQSEQLPILYVKGFNDDGSGWGETGLYFQNLADITDGQSYAKGSAGIETYGIQFWSTDFGDPNLDPENDSFDRSGAVVQTLDDLADPNNVLRKPSAQEFILNSLSEIFAGLFDPENWVLECPDLLDVTSCHIPALSYDFAEARSSYNVNGLARYHAEDLLELLQDQLGRVGPLSGESQVNFLTHSAGGLDTRAALALLQATGDPALQQAVSNVVYTAPPFGGSTGAEMLNAFYENDTLGATLLDPWVTEYLTDAYWGPFESLARLFIAEPIVASVYQAIDLFSGSYDTLAEKIAAVPDAEAVSLAIDQTIDELDGFIKNVTAHLPSGSFGLAEIDEFLSTDSNSFDPLFRGSITNELIVPIVRQVLTAAMGLPGQPKLRDDLRPYEAIHDNLEQFDANLQIPQFVVWGEGGFLRFLAGDAAPNTPVPINQGPPLELAAADPRSLHAYGNEDRQGLDFSQIDTQPGDGNLSRTSALFLTDLAGGYMKALAGFSRHTHGTIPTDLFTSESNIQGSFLQQDDDNQASLGEVIVETLLTPVTSLAVTEETVVVDPDARIYRLNGDAEISFESEEKIFLDEFNRVFSVRPSGVEYRVAAEDQIDHADWILVDPNQFSRRAVSLSSGLGIADEQPFTLQWRSLNQHGGREAIRSATFIIDTNAPSLQYVDVFDAESPDDGSQIYFNGRPLISNTFQSRRFDGPATFSKPIDWYINLDRGKQIHLEFDSPTNFEYAWNDPNLSSPSTSVQGDPAAGIIELFVRRNEAGSVPVLGIGLTYLEEGTQVLYYRTSDANGNQSAIQSIEFFVDASPPQLQFSVANNQIVGPQTPITFLATDVGVGISEARVTLPGVGNLGSGASFSLSETAFASQINSGESVSLNGLAEDLVGNQQSTTFSLVYDYLGPSTEIESISVGTRLADGRIITTVPEVTVVFRVDDDAAGLDEASLSWSVGAAGNGALSTGTPRPLGDGRYEVKVPLAIGENHLQLRATDNVGNPSFTIQTLLRSPSHRLELDRGDRVSGVDFGNTRFGSISGFIFNDATGDLRYDYPDDPPLENVAVYVDRNSNGRFDAGEAMVFSDVEGRYQFNHLPPRTYDIRVMVPAGYELVSPPDGLQSVSLGIQDSVDHLSFGFEFLGATIAGRVFDDANGNGELDAGESPISGFGVNLSVGAMTSNRDFVTATDADGHFSFSGLQPGDYTVLINEPAQYESTTDTSRVVSIAEGQVDDKTFFGLFETTSVSGSVFEDLNKDGNRDAGEPMLSDFVVEVDYHSDGSIDQTMQSTESGFDFFGLPFGQHVVSLVLPEGFTQSQFVDGGDYSIAIESGTQLVDLDFGVIDRRGVVTGTKFEDRNGNAVHDPAEPGLAGWTIYADINDNKVLDPDEPTTTTSSDGSYELRLPVGDYVIREVPQAGWNQTFPVAVDYQSIAISNFVKGNLSLSGPYIVWGESTSPGGRLRRFDGNNVVDIVVIEDEGITSFDVTRDGTVSWALDPDRFDNDSDENDIYQNVSGTVRRLTRNGVEDGDLLTDGDHLIYKSGNNLFLNDGEKTIVLSQTAGIAAADGGSVVFNAIDIAANRIGLYHYNGELIREISDAASEFVFEIDVHGSYTAWVQYDSASQWYSVWRDDGQGAQQIDTGPETATEVQVDASGNVAWLRWFDEDNAEVIFHAGGALSTLTSDGSRKLDLSLDAGVAAWSRSTVESSRVFIYDGREILEPGFSFCYGPVVEEGRVAFFASDIGTLTTTDVYVTDVRSYHAVSIDVGQSVSEIDFGNRAETATLSGSVFADLDGDGVQDPGEGPLNRADIELLLLPSRQVLDTVSTDESGQFEFAVEHGVEYLVRVSVGPGEEVTFPENRIYTLTPTAGSTNVLTFAVTTNASTDSDGIPDSVEDGAPFGGDGNNDGVPDRQQPHVASLPNAEDDTYVTIVAPEGTELVAVTAFDDHPEPDKIPSDAKFPVGFISFELHGIEIGETVDVRLVLHNNSLISNYYKYGPTPDDTDPHYYRFTRTSKWGIQSLSPGEVVLRFTDGRTGDDDLTENGVIVDPGAPLLITSGRVQNPIDPFDVNNDGETSPLDALQVINYLARNQGDGEFIAAMGESLVFLDVNVDDRVSPLDALAVLNEIARRTSPMTEAEMPPPLASDWLRPYQSPTDDEEFEHTIGLLAHELVRRSPLAPL